MNPKALCAFWSPTTNSYKRLVPGFEAPVNLAYSSRNRSASIRIPTYSENPKAKRVEYRPPDPAANPYVAFAAMLSPDAAAPNARFVPAVLLAGR